MKKITSILLTVALLATILSVFALPASAEELSCFERGDGTATNPYQIASKEQLENLASLVNNGEECLNTYFILTNDIDSFSSTIGDTSHLFRGHFDGNGHTVALNISLKNSNDVGMFGYLWSESEIKNLTTTGGVSGVTYVGGICGRLYGGKIINCCNTCVVGGKTQVGGICGRNSSGKIINCCNISVIDGDKLSGVLCGSNGGTVANCYYDINVCSGNAVGSNAAVDTFGLPSEQVQAPSGSTLNTGVANNKPLVDLLNGYVEAHQPDILNYWKTENGKLLQTNRTSEVGSVLSEGNLWIIIAIAVVALGGFFIGTKKKKKPALAEGTDNTDEE